MRLGTLSKASVGILSVIIAGGAAALVAAQAQAPAPAPAAAQQPGTPEASPQGTPNAVPQSTPGAPETAPARGGRGRGGRGGGNRTPAYPVHPPADPAVVARGNQIFSVNCSFCHGSDARGGEGGGPNLIRSELVLNDNNGELIAQVVQNGRPDKGMPKFDLSMADISAIAAFIHSFPVGGRAAISGEAVDPLVGNAVAGQAFFNGAGKCSTCHSVTGDLAGIGDKLSDPRILQGAILSGEAGRGRGAAAVEADATPPQRTVTVTLPSGQAYEGKLDKIDDFFVALTEADDTHVSFRRDGDEPKVVVTNPLQPHLDMLTKLTDDEIHNLTAYLVTVK